MNETAAARPGVAVVTGGTGFIGWALCESLRDAGWEVRAVVRPSSSNPLPPDVERWDAELDAEAMAPACAGADVVYHLAGLTRAPSMETFLAVNAEGARQAALAARNAGAYFVLVSSQAAAGTGTPDRVRHEDDAPAPVSDYGRSKLAGEAVLAEIEDLRYSIVRPPGVYGPRDQDFFALFRAASRGLVPRIGSPDKAYTLIHVDDAVTALRTVADAGMLEVAAVHRETFFIGHPEIVSQRDIAAALRAAVGGTPRELPVPGTLLRVLAELGEIQGRITGRPALLNRNRFREITAPGFVCSVAKITTVTTWRATYDLEGGFRATATWYREAGWLRS